MKAIRIAEIFGPTVQGEGGAAGRPSIFVRTAGCDLRCAWCDSLFAVDAERYHQDWRTMSAEAVAAEVARLADGAPYAVTLTGGNPALQPLGPLCDALHARGHEVLLETQGTFAPDWLDKVDAIAVSPKGPSSRMGFDQAAFLTFMSTANRAGAARVGLKVVVADADDMDFALAVHALTPENRLFVQPCNPNPDDTRREVLLERYEWLIGEVLRRRRPDIIVLPQLHTLVWGSERGR